MTPDQVALELIAHATISAKRIGSPIGPDKVLEIIEKALRENVPDAPYADAIIASARSYL